MKFRIATLLLFGWYTSYCFSQSNFAFSNWDTTPLQKYETRAVWLTTLSNLDWPKTWVTSDESREQQKRELIDILDKLAAANINTVLFQTRVRAATLYPSKLEPWDKCLTGRENGDPGYDPLAFAVEECHKRGMEIHAWLATIPVGSHRSLGCRLLKQKGLDIKNFSSGSYLNPADPGVASYLGEICAEITNNYDIDGINLDYIRYPDHWRRPTYRNGDTPDERRAHITAIVREINHRVKKAKPWVKVSCSPIGKYADLTNYSSKNYNARDRVSQEAQEWVKQGIMDQLYPMQYFRGDNYYPFCADWMENSNGRDIITGLGTYFLDPREGNWTIGELTREMYVSRWLGMGHAHFRAKFLLDNRQGIYNFEKRFNVLPALTPPMKQTQTRQPEKPRYAEGTTIVSSIESNGTKNISWKGASPYYNIYMSSVYPVDTKDPRNLVMTKFAGHSFAHEDAGNNYYAITAMDRYGNESEPLQSSFKKIKVESNLLPNNKKQITLPQWLENMDIDYYVITSMQGNAIKRSYYRKSQPLKINIMDLANGTYQIYAHSAKRKVLHKVGNFFVKR